MNPPKFLTELKRRNVYRVAVAYGVVAWFLTQLTTQVFPFFEIPNSAVLFVVIALAVGFPIAMLLSWIYELTPEGVVRTEDLDPVQARSVQRASGRILDFIIIGALLLVIAMLIVGRLPSLKQTGESISQKSIAILPFANLSEEKANAYFAEGIQNEILTRLATVRDLKVISRSSTAKYQSRPDNLKTVAQELSVSNILEGAVQKAGDKVRVNVQWNGMANSGSSRPCMTPTSSPAPARFMVPSHSLSNRCAAQALFAAAGSSACHPTPRWSPIACAIAYDSKRDRTVLFGGFHRPSKGPNESFGDTWELAEKLPAVFGDTAGGG